MRCLLRNDYVRTQSATVLSGYFWKSPVDLILKGDLLCFLSRG